jgi:hypothetical protein
MLGIMTVLSDTVVRCIIFAVKGPDPLWVQWFDSFTEWEGGEFNAEKFIVKSSNTHKGPCAHSELNLPPVLWLFWLWCYYFWIVCCDVNLYGSVKPFILEWWNCFKN